MRIEDCKVGQWVKYTMEVFQSGAIVAGQIVDIVDDRISIHYTIDLKGSVIAYFDGYFETRLISPFAMEPMTQLDIIKQELNG